MNPQTFRFEPLVEVPPMERELARLKELLAEEKQLAVETSPRLLRPNGEPVPQHWTIFTLGEQVKIKGYLFKVAYVGETSILFEPVGPVTIESSTTEG